MMGIQHEWQQYNLSNQKCICRRGQLRDMLFMYSTNTKNKNVSRMTFGRKGLTIYRNVCVCSNHYVKPIIGFSRNVEERLVMIKETNDTIIGGAPNNYLNTGTFLCFERSCLNFFTLLKVDETDVCALKVLIVLNCISQTIFCITCSLAKVTQLQILQSQSTHEAYNINVPRKPIPLMMKEHHREVSYEL